MAAVLLAMNDRKGVRSTKVVKGMKTLMLARRRNNGVAKQTTVNLTINGYKRGCNHRSNLYSIASN